MRALSCPVNVHPLSKSVAVESSYLQNCGLDSPGYRKVEQEERHIASTRAHTWAPSQRSSTTRSGGPRRAPTQVHDVACRAIGFAMAGTRRSLATTGSSFNRRSDGIVTVVIEDFQRNGMLRPQRGRVVIGDRARLGQRVVRLLRGDQAQLRAGRAVVCPTAQCFHAGSPPPTAVL